jgi:hypothetical protein
VEVFIRLASGGLLIAHGLVHLMYVAPDADDPDAPFTLHGSWLPGGSARPVALALIAATVAAFALLGLAVWGVPGLSGAWAMLATAGAAASLALLVAFWDTRLLFGVVVDVALLALVVTRPGWTDRIAT